jgi:hypothetical protein
MQMAWHCWPHPSAELVVPRSSFAALSGVPPQAARRETLKTPSPPHRRKGVRQFFLT